MIACRHNTADDQLNIATLRRRGLIIIKLDGGRPLIQRKLGTGSWPNNRPLKQPLGGFAFRYLAACVAAQTFAPPARTVPGTNLSRPGSPPLLRRAYRHVAIN